MNLKKSNLRSKETVVTVGDLLGKEVVAASIPGGGLMYDLAKSLINHGKQYYSDRTASRLEDFHKALLNGIESQKEYSSFIEKPFCLDDYFALLSSCVQDIENEKVEIYSQLMRGLIDEDITPETRRHFVKACQTFTYFELCFLKDLYINSKYDLMTVGGIQRQVEAMLSTNEPLRRIAIEKLIPSGFIDKERSNITSMGENFISLIFPSDGLSPEAVGQKPFSGIIVLIISYQLADSLHSTVATEIEKALLDNQVKSSIGTLDSNQPFLTYIYKFAFLIVDGNPFEPEYIETLSKFSEKRPLFRININNNSKSNNVGSISFKDDLTLDSTEPFELKKQVAQYVSRILDS